MANLDVFALSYRAAMRRRSSWRTVALACSAAVWVAGCTSGARAEPDTRNGLVAVWNAASRHTHDGDFAASYELLDAACRAKWTRPAWTKNLSRKDAAEKNAHFDAVVIDPVATARIQTFTKARALVLADIAPYPPLRGQPSYPPPFEYEQMLFFPSSGVWTYEHGAWVTGWCPRFGPTEAAPGTG